MKIFVLGRAQKLCGRGPFESTNLARSIENRDSNTFIHTDYIALFRWNMLCLCDSANEKDLDWKPNVMHVFILRSVYVYWCENALHLQTNSYVMQWIKFRIFVYMSILCDLSCALILFSSWSRSELPSEYHNISTTILLILRNKGLKCRLS